MKKVLFLQSWFSNIDDNWYGWLKAELEKKGYLVNFTDIPEFRKETPKLNNVLKTVKNLNFVDKNTVVIGHSLGALVAMRLAEKEKIKSLVLVSGWDFDDLTAEHKYFWKAKMNQANIKKNSGSIYVFHSDNDPYINQFQSEGMSKRLGAKFTLIKGAGHFLKKDGCIKLPQLLKVI